MGTASSAGYGIAELGKEKKNIPNLTIQPAAPVTPMSWVMTVPKLWPLIILTALPFIFSSRAFSSYFPVTQRLTEFSNIIRAEQRGRICCTWIGAIPNTQDEGWVMRGLSPRRSTWGVGG